MRGAVSKRFAMRKWAPRARVRVQEAGWFPRGSLGRARKHPEQKGWTTRRGMGEAEEVVLFSEPPRKDAEAISSSESSLFTIKLLFKMEKGKETRRKRERRRLLPASSLPNSQQSATELCLISR